MGQSAKPTRHNRTITVDFHDETTSFALLGDTKAFVECVLAFLPSLGLQLTHKASCSAGGRLTYGTLKRQFPHSTQFSGGAPAPSCPPCNYAVLPSSWVISGNDHLT